MADELTADEERLLTEHMTGDTVPAPDAEEGAPAAPAEAAPTAPPAPVAEPAPAVEPAAIGQTDDERFAAFMAANAGKTPEELAKIAFQQSQRAASEAFRGRQARESLETINGRVRAASEAAAAARARVAQERQQFDARLASDPDAATREVHDRMMTAEERAADEMERGARVEAAWSTAATIPGFDPDATRAFGAEMNYSPEELAGVSDPRDVVTLHLAGLSGRLIKAGIMDAQGNMLAAPGAVAATDPRLTAPTPPTTLSSAPARPAGGAKTVTQQATDVLNMSESDFARLPPAELDALMKQLQG